jgi:hypothetical protein
VTQPSLLDLAARVERPRKRVRQVSRQAYAEVRATNAGRRRDDVLRCLAACFNETQTWPTDAELTYWMFQRKELPREDPNLVRPRRFELMEMGLLEKGTARKCRVTGKTAHPWKIRER